MAGAEVAEDVREGPGADDLSVSPNGQLIRDVGTGAGGLWGGGGALLGGKEEGGLAFQRIGGGAFCGGAISKDDGNEDAEGAKEEAEHESVPALPGACKGASDEGAENPDEEDGDGFHRWAMVREKRGRRQAVRVRVCEAQSRRWCGNV